MSKKSIFKKILVASTVCIVLSSCEGEEGPQGPQGDAGADGASGLISINPEPAGTNCPTGGFRIDVGTDSNGDGALAGDEITATDFACNGGNGTDFLVSSSEESAGTNCPFGGFRIDSGLDADGDGQLDSDEITDTFYVCNGADGAGAARIGDYNWSNLDPLVTMSPNFQHIRVSALLSSTDVLPTFNANDFQLGGSADGAGAVIDGEGNIAVLANCEDHYSVVRVILDPLTLEPMQGDYMVNSGVFEYARQCSGTMWEAAIHGGNEDFFISASENYNFECKRIDIDETPNPTDNSDAISGLGHFHWENAVPLPQNAYAGSTVVIGGDDDSSGSEGQLTLYWSDQGDDDLDNGSIYVLSLADSADQDGVVYNEGDLDFGVDYAVEFVEIPNGASLNKDEMETASDTVSLHFMRIEDVDYGKGSDANARTIFFAVTGRGPGRDTYNDWGTGYKLVLNETNPTQGILTQVISGNTDTNNMDGNMPLLQSPDNICVTENYVYWQEDPNSFSRGHNAFIWQSDWDGNSIVPVLQIDRDPFIDAIDGEIGTFDGRDGEFGALVDITDKVPGATESVFLLCLQPHYWNDPLYAGIDGDVRTVFDSGEQTGGREDAQGSQIVILQGLPR